jgi:hypothetical protein
VGLEALEKLSGRWQDERREGEPGVATAGGETWRLALDGQLLVRDGWCEFPAKGDRPAFRHEDLLVIYVDADHEVRAEFWDTDGHHIRYRDVRPDPDGNGVGFVSDPAVPGPRQWLQYRFEGDDRLSAVFSLHAPGTPDFVPYLRWSSRRSADGPT